MHNPWGNSNGVAIVVLGSILPDITAPMRTGYTFDGVWDALEGGVQYYDASRNKLRVWDKTDNVVVLYVRMQAHNYRIRANANGDVYNGLTADTLPFLHTDGEIRITTHYEEIMPNMTVLPTRNDYKLTGFLLLPKVDRYCIMRQE
jgi:hypothetical protein